MDDRSIKFPKVEIPTASSSIDKAIFSLESYLVEQSESFDQILRLISLSDTVLSYRHLVDLPIMASRLPLRVVHAIALCFWMSADTPCINVVFLRKVVLNTCVLGDISVCHSDIRVYLFKPGIERPAHDPHEGCIFVGWLALDFLW